MRMNESININRIDVEILFWNIALLIYILDQKFFSFARAEQVMAGADSYDDDVLDEHRHPHCQGKAHLASKNDYWLQKNS